jgi:hypothetical protein
MVIEAPGYYLPAQDAFRAHNGGNRAMNQCLRCDKRIADGVMTVTCVI